MFDFSNRTNKVGQKEYYISTPLSHVVILYCYIDPTKKKKKLCEPKMYSFRPTFFVLFKKSNFLRKHYLLSCLPFKNVEVFKTTLKKIYQKIELVN